MKTPQQLCVPRKHGFRISKHIIVVNIISCDCSKVNKQVHTDACNHLVPTGSKPLTLWGRVTHICIGKLTIIASDNGLSPGWCQAIIWTNTGILLIWTSGANFSEILNEINTFSFKKMHLKMSSVNWLQFCLSLNVLTEPLLTKFYDVICHYQGPMIYMGVWCIRHNMFFYMDVYFLEKLAINVDTLSSPPHFKSKIFGCIRKGQI